MSRHITFSAFGLLLLPLCAPALLGAQVDPAQRSTVITHVTVIDATGAPPRSNQTVIVSGNRIVSLGNSGEIAIPRNSRVVDGTGKFLIPGLWDMHGHTVYARPADTERALLPLFVANGITGIRNLGSLQSLDQINHWRASAAAGKLLAPRQVVGQQIDGAGGISVSFVYRVTTASEARAAVDRIKREGFDFVKVHGRLSREAYFAVADRARQLRIPFAGHVPLAVSNGEASEAGQKSIEHLEGMLVSVSSDETRLRKEWIEHETAMAALNGRPAPPELDGRLFDFITRGINSYDADKAAQLYGEFVRNGTYHCPTLVIHQAWGSLSTPTFFDDPRRRYVPGRQRRGVNMYLDAARSWSSERKAVARRLYEYRLRMVGEMRRAGVRLLAGTDMGFDGYPVAGFALHDELALLVHAGLSPMEALQTATINPASFLGLSDSLGTVERGKVADLVLLDRNPLDDIGNTKGIAAVIANGRVLSKEELAGILRSVERH